MKEWVAIWRITELRWVHVPYGSPGYLCESQIVTVCQDSADSLDEAERIDTTIIDFEGLCGVSAAFIYSYE
jgi:hypothetical protein